jgi:hypothetical protein
MRGKSEAADLLLQPSLSPPPPPPRCSDVFFKVSIVSHIYACCLSCAPHTEEDGSEILHAQTAVIQILGAGEGGEKSQHKQRHIEERSGARRKL